MGKVTFLITGLDGPVRDNVQILLEECIKNTQNQPSEMEACLRAGPASIKKAMQPYGYFNPTISSGEMSRLPGLWIIRYAIQKGPPVTLSAVTVRLTGLGKEDPFLNRQLAQFPLKPGDRLDTARYEKARDALLQTASQQGWIKAVFLQKSVEIDAKEHTARILLVLQTGPRFFFGPVRFDATPLAPDFLQRFVPFQENEAFSSNKLLNLQEALSNSGYFREVLVTPEPGHALSNRIPVHIALTPAPARRWLMGFGYGTFTGPRASLSADFRRAGDRGQRFTLQSGLSAVLKTLSATYHIPHPPQADEYVLGAGIQKFSPENGDSLSENLSVSRLMTIGTWQHELGLHFLNERFQVNSQAQRYSRLLYPEYVLLWRVADDPLNPSNASSVRLGIRGASENLVSFTSFLQTDLRLQKRIPLGTQGGLVLRGQVGYTTVRNLSSLPLSLRYVAGGTGSIRGYEYGSIGPGRYLETAGIEYQHVLRGNISGAVFFDAGTATNHFGDPLQKGVGIGIIYHSPAGPIRISVARALSTPSHPFSLEFSMGPDF